MLHRHNKTGFTIVELLIVIVVIGILAAITVVAYNGVQARATDAKIEAIAQSSLKGAQLFAVDSPHAFAPPVGTSRAEFLRQFHIEAIADDLKIGGYSAGGTAHVANNITDDDRDNPDKTKVYFFSYPGTNVVSRWQNNKEAWVITSTDVGGYNDSYESPWSPFPLL